MNILELIHTFKLQLALLIAFLSVVYYWSNDYLWEEKTDFIYRTLDNKEVQSESSNQLPILFTKANLAEFKGNNGEPIYLGILGKVYDVTKGIKHYGPGAPYHYFAGRDASVAFVTGDFDKYIDEDADDVLRLTNDHDLYSLDKWQQFYENDYIYIGRVIGRFYNNHGQPTEYHKMFVERVEDIKRKRVHEQEIKAKYPDCNVEWAPSTGTHVWCTKESGGYLRNWVGYPRKLYEIGQDDFRCACIQESDLLADSKDVMLKSYQNCNDKAHECFYQID